MTRRSQFIKSKTDYVLRNKHTVTNVGTIFENDHMTIVPDDDIYNEDIAMFSDSNFKFRIRRDVNGKKKHFSGVWLSNPSGDSEYWTEECCSGVTTDETKIRLKPNYSSLKDFAYYGAVGELIKASVKDAILNYPGGMCYIASGGTIEGKKIVGNFFGIDVWTPATEVENMDNPLKVLSLSYDKYLCNGSPISTFSINRTTNACGNLIATTTINGITLYTYLNDNGEHVVAANGGTHGNVILEPKPEVFAEEYDKLDDFVRVLLNIYSKPFFTAELETPYFDGQGYYYAIKKYTWPSISGNGKTYPIPETSGPRFDGYLKALLSIAKFHDEYDTDNIWRMLTHDSIKNLDWTFLRNDGDEGIEDLSDMDNTRIKGVLELYGRQYDDLRRYANNIKASNSVTYDGKNNTPDYFLTDCLENDGWDAYHVGPTKDNSIVTNVIYTGSTNSGSTAAEANTEFIKRMILNSDYIQSLKGTKKGLEVILSMFGISGSEYTITEQIGIASEFPKSDKFKELLPYYDDYYYGDDILAGWPIVEVAKDDNEENNYLIPWYANDEEHPFYFQQKGGWEYMTDKKVQSASGFTTITAITGSFIDLFGETLQYMKYAQTLYELTGLTTDNLFEGCVCYVEDITGMEEDYVGDATDSAKISQTGFSGFSHYFVLKNVELSNVLGYLDNDVYSCYGWRNVFSNEFDGTGTLTCDGERVLYMETIKTTFVGNNPHVGYGKYDNGESYLDYFNQLFKDEIEHNKFSSVDLDDTEVINAINTIGFKIPAPVDTDEKCYYFTDGENSFLTGTSVDGVAADEDNTVSSWGYPEFKSPEDAAKNDESASFSVINLKNICITFTVKNDEHKKYIEDVVLRYVEQMMPSTAIFSYKFSGSRFTATAADMTTGRGNELVRVYGDAATTQGLSSNARLGADLVEGGFDPEII